VVASAESADELIDAIDAEPALLPARPRPTTLRVEGGAPTALPVPLLGRLLDSIRAHVALGRTREFSVAIAPRSVTPAKAALLSAAGANRALVRVRSFDAFALRTLGCLHDSDVPSTAIGWLRSAGFARISIELECGLPESSDEAFLETIDRTIAEAPDHVVVRPFRPHPASTLARWFEEGRLDPVPPGTTARRFALAVERLGSAGFEHYAAHAFARKNGRSVERVEEWGGRPTLGVGPGARSDDGRVVRVNVADPDLYVRRMLDTGAAEASRRRRTKSSAAAADLRRALDSVAGVTLAPIAKRWGIDLEGRVGPSVRREIRRGRLESRHRRFRLTPVGWPVAQDVLAAFA
jgi:oxygen-independent coproporphyrinogen-3 oxidase